MAEWKDHRRCRCTYSGTSKITDTLGRIILSIIERLSSFRGNNVLPLYRLIGALESVLYSECPLSDVPLYIYTYMYIHIYMYI